ncbi:hypothetical protein ElyMa_004914700 [Elysia marginata]|uniref:Uncharacterized protein n=1 Tax=Elysia marginata TaxID=1093978 RepID=A0AAV4IYE7_9GAST|nr:hypothetical protein ElyMa_004914700 [Elysia marginata]
MSLVECPTATHSEQQLCILYCALTAKYLCVLLSHSKLAPENKLTFAIRVGIAFSRELKNDRIHPRYLNESTQGLVANLDVRLLGYGSSCRLFLLILTVSPERLVVAERRGNLPVVAGHAHRGRQQNSHQSRTRADVTLVFACRLCTNCRLKTYPKCPAGDMNAWFCIPADGEQRHAE